MCRQYFYIDFLHIVNIDSIDISIDKQLVKLHSSNTQGLYFYIWFFDVCCINIDKFLSIIFIETFSKLYSICINVLH